MQEEGKETRNRKRRVGCRKKEETKNRKRRRVKRKRI